MKSRLGIVMATTAAIGCAGFLVLGADAQDDSPPPPASAARPLPTPPPGPGGRDFGRRGGDRGGAIARFSPQDRAAFFDAHIAAVKAGLELTSDQQTLWTPVEQAVRDLTKTMTAQRRKFAEEGRPQDPIQRLRNQGDAAAARGQALQKLADAAGPLWTSLSDDQKRRLPILMHGMRGRGGMQPRDGMQQQQNGWRERTREGMRRDDDANQRQRD